MKNHKKLEGRERGKAYLKYATQNWVTILFIILSVVKRDILGAGFGIVAFGFMLYICVSQEEYYKKKNIKYEVNSTWNGLASKFIVSVVFLIVVSVISLVHQAQNRELYMNGENIFLCGVLFKTYWKTIFFIFLQILLDFVKEKVGKWISQKFPCLKN